MNAVELRKRPDSERKAYIEGALAAYAMFEDVVERHCELTGSKEIETLRVLKRHFEVELERLGG